MLLKQWHHEVTVSEGSVTVHAHAVSCISHAEHVLHASGILQELRLIVHAAKGRAGKAGKGLAATAAPVALVSGAGAPPSSELRVTA